MTGRSDRLLAGRVTFLFTDIEGSTRLLQEIGGDRYAERLLDHRQRVRRVVAEHGGVEFGTEGDAFFIVFASPSDALDAAAAMQAAFAGGQVHVRIGIHSGEAL